MYLPAVNRKHKSTATQVDARRVDPESASRVRIHVGPEEEAKLDASDGSNREFFGEWAPVDLRELLRFRRKSVCRLRGNGSQAGAFRGGD